MKYNIGILLIVILFLLGCSFDNAKKNTITRIKEINGRCEYQFVTEGMPFSDRTFLDDCKLFNIGDNVYMKK